MTKALVVLSGGQDSTTCLFWAKQRYEHVRAISFDYNQRHKIELDAARKIAAMADVPHDTISLGQIFQGTSPLTSDNAIEQYESADTLPDSLENTFVPARNLLFLTLAGNVAYVHGITDIILGVSQEDYGGYPDCREAFITSMQQTLSLALDIPVNIVTPLVNMNKKQTVELAAELGPTCMEALSYSHTCYNGSIPPCGTCHACLLRQRGFTEAGMPDPLIERCQQEKLAS